MRVDEALAANYADSLRRRAGLVLRVQDLWWLHPGVAFLAIVGITAILAWLIPPAVYLSEWDTPKYITDESLMYVMGVCALFVLGTAASGAAHRNDQRVLLTPGMSLSAASIRQVFWGSFWLTLIGYCVWIAAGIARGLSPGVVYELITGSQGAASAMREVYLVTIPGITTMTQFGVSAVILGTITYCRSPQRSVRWGLIILFFLGAMRALFYSERLALIELGVPAAIVFLRMAVVGRMLSRPKRTAIVWLPVIGTAAILIYFSVSEYFRSWSYHSADRGSTFLDYVITRFISYYATSINNGALLTQHWQTWPPHIPYYTFESFWRFPLFGEFNLYEHMTGINPPLDWQAMLQHSANVEYNNPGGTFLMLSELGMVGSALFWLAAGVACGEAFYAFRRGAQGGLLLFPILMIAIMETPRIQYILAPRTLPSLLVLVPLAAFQSRLR